MSEAHLVVAGVRVCASGGSVTVTELDPGSGGDTIVPSSAFFPSLTATLDVIQIGPGAFAHVRITSITIPRHVQILCSQCFSNCRSFSSISFETDSELTRIESQAFWNCCSLKSITIPRHVQILCSQCFSNCRSLSSVSFERKSELARIEIEAFDMTSLLFVVVPDNVSLIAGNALPTNCVVDRRGCRCGIQ
jgi:hypothetical protein